MTLDYATCLALKEAGFPQDTHFRWAKVPNYHPRVFMRSSDGVLMCESDGDSRWEESDAAILCAAPTLSELIDGCGDSIKAIHRNEDGTWSVFGGVYNFRQWVDGPTHEAAVAALYLAIHGKGNV